MKAKVNIISGSRNLIEGFIRENIMLPKRTRFILIMICSLLIKEKFAKFQRYIS